MSDRLDEIKARDTYWPIRDGVRDGDIDWLIAEVERLRVCLEVSDADRLQLIQQRLDSPVVALRGALQALVDATAPVTAITYSLMSIHDTSWEQFDAARAVAVELLTGDPDVR